ncbi:MAG: hypothetical protein EP329_24210 [Deltaproteobacteria bacterium]|nr:MAG: hypothetical protein EP329_24210 [Deltaproteobacteria bacterium]
MQHPRLHRLAVAATFALAACGSDAADKDPVTAPALSDGKSDLAGATVDELGRLSFGGEALGEFVRDGQLDAYRFTAEAGARVTLDNTNKGTARALDTTLFLYGPLAPGEAPSGAPIAEDDDGGWGRHARIQDFVLPARGDYVAVLGTYAGLDRGAYRLTLACEGDACVVSCDGGCADEDPCTEDRCDPVDGCVHALLPGGCDARPVVVTAGELVTSEARDSDRFSVRLTAAPTAHVVVWVETSDADEAVPYPSKLVFCAPGFVPDPNGCVAAADPDAAAIDPDWAREVAVTVYGVRDAEAGDDAPFTLSFTVASEDPTYAGVALAPVTGVNLDDPTPLDDLADLDGLADDALLDALYARISGHVAYGYLGQNSIRTVMFSTVDVHGGVVESVYDGSTVTLPRDASIAYTMGFNTEHTWPQAQFDKLEPMKSDLHHIFPTDARSNALRASYDYGMVERDPGDASALGESERGVERVYQVRPSRRGDIARAHFYMVARYRAAGREIGIVFDDDDRDDNGAINDVEEAVLRRWHAEDPVDALERERNHRVEAYQGNRNPFVDHPELVDRVADF